MTYSNGQRLERHEVEPWVAERHQHPYFKASVIEREQLDKGRVHITITITGPNGEPCVDVNRKAVYYSTRAIPGMVQFSEDWTA